MKKQILFFLGAILSTFAGVAQVQFATDSAELIYINKDNFQYSSQTTITNNNTDPADTVFTWERYDNSISGDWGTAICDKEYCFPEETNTATMNIGIGKTVSFKVNFYTKGVKDCGSVSVRIYSQMDQFNADSFYTEVCSFDPASVGEVKQSNISIYPNPAKNFVVVESSDNGNLEIEVYDVLGNLMLKANQPSGNRLNVMDLPKGVYIVRVKGDHTSATTFQKI